MAAIRRVKTGIVVRYLERWLLVDRVLGEGESRRSTRTKLRRICHITGLFIVGSNDKKIIDINKRTMDQMENVTHKKIEVAEGASHLFEEEGTIERVGKIATEWLKDRF